MPTSTFISMASVSSFPVPSFLNYTIGFRNETIRASDVCLLFHGFPAAVIMEPEQEKNHDIARSVSANTGIDTYVQHYRGLGRSAGKFSFMGSIKESIEYARKIKDTHDYGKVHLIGHSWGAIVALNILEALGTDIIGNIVLLSPFNTFPARDILRGVLKAVCKDVNIDFEAGGVEGALDELEEIIAKYNPKDIAKRVSLTQGRLTIIQATDDEEVPVETTRGFAQLFKKRPVYIEFPSDHRFFSRRMELFSLIAASIRDIP